MFIQQAFVFSLGRNEKKIPFNFQVTYNSRSCTPHWGHLGWFIVSYFTASFENLCFMEPIIIDGMQSMSM